MRYKLGDLVELVTETNSELQYGLDDIVGVTLEKQMIPTIANLTQTDLDDFIIVHPKDFIYNPRTHGKKIGLGFNTTDRCYISSWNNNTFRVKPTMSDVILPEYLYMYFLRDRWDKEACFNAWGSSTVVLLWSSFCDMKITLPSIDKQRQIVHDYQTVSYRIELLRRINDNLEAQAQSLFDSMFVTDDSSDCVLADIALVNPPRQLAKGSIAKCFDMSTLPTKGCIPEGEVIKPYNGGVRFINGDTLLARITPCLENGKAAYINLLEKDEVAFGSTEFIVFASKDNIPSSFYYFLIRNSRFVTFALQFMNGSSGRQRVSGEELASFPIKRPSSENLKIFDSFAGVILDQMRDNVLEIVKLYELQEIMTSVLF